MFLIYRVYDLGFLLCIIGLVAYMRLQLKFSAEGQDKDKRIAIAKKTLQDGKMSLKGVLKPTILEMESKRASTVQQSEYGSLTSPSGTPDPEVLEVLKELLHDAFIAYDVNHDGRLERSEIRVFLKDFHENISDEQINEIQSIIRTCLYYTRIINSTIIVTVNDLS